MVPLGVLMDGFEDGAGPFEGYRVAIPMRKTCLAD